MNCHELQRHLGIPSETGIRKARQSAIECVAKSLLVHCSFNAGNNCRSPNIFLRGWGPADLAGWIGWLGFLPCMNENYMQVTVVLPAIPLLKDLNITGWVELDIIPHLFPMLATKKLPSIINIDPSLFVNVISGLQPSSDHSKLIVGVSIIVLLFSVTAFALIYVRKLYILNKSTDEKLARSPKGRVNSNCRDPWERRKSPGIIVNEIVS